MQAYIAVRSRRQRANGAPNAPKADTGQASARGADEPYSLAGTRRT
jgi:hypothetical protein